MVILKNERDLNIFLVISYIKNNQRKNREYKGRKKINNEMINKKYNWLMWILNNSNLIVINFEKNDQIVFEPLFITFQFNFDLNHLGFPDPIFNKNGDREDLGTFW